MLNDFVWGLTIFSRERNGFFIFACKDPLNKYSSQFFLDGVPWIF